jgi:hypothetical protein
MAMKLLVTDIDETLSFGESLTPEVTSACARLREKGWAIMVATGRILATALPHIRGTGTSLPAILYDGGRMMEPYTGKTLFETAMDPSLALEIVHAGWEHPVELQIIGDERAVCRNGDTMTRSFFTDVGIPVDCSLTEPLVPHDVFRVIFHGIPGCIRSLQRDLNRRFSGRAEIVQAGEGFLDILPLGVSKGSALRRWLQTLPQAPEIIVAAGDHHNDLEMLREADVAVVPENAAPEVFDIADVIMPSAKKDGFVYLADWLLHAEIRRDETPSPIVL